MNYGVIVEYNPLHNGHLHHLSQIKALMKENDVLIAVMSGYLCQRGEISIFSKKTKTEWALEAGIDLVCEIPSFLAIQNATVFATTAIKILNELKVDCIVFGSEINSSSYLEKIANEQLKNTEYLKKAKQQSKLGVSYAKAYGSENLKPNDILGVEYIKTIIKNKYKIKYLTIQRTNEYHSYNLDEIASATAIRNALIVKENVKSFVPKYVFKDLEKFENKEKEIFKYLKYQLTISDVATLNSYLFINEGIENRILKYYLECSSLEELIKKVKTKRYTYNHIKKVCLAILLQIEKREYQVSYINILGYSNIGQQHINSIKKKMNIPFLKNREDDNYKNEIKVAKFYDLIYNIGSLEFELMNIPLKKEKK